MSFVATLKMYVLAHTRLNINVNNAPTHLPTSSSSKPNVDVAIFTPISGNANNNIDNTITPPFVPGSKKTGNLLLGFSSEFSDKDRDDILEYCVCSCGCSTTVLVLNDMSLMPFIVFVGITNDCTTHTDSNIAYSDDDKSSANFIFEVDLSYFLIFLVYSSNQFVF